MVDHYIDSCPDCGGQGLVIVVKNKLTNQLMLLCDECSDMWLNPEDFYNGRRTVPYYNAQLELADGVSDEEIIEAGWDKYVKNMGSPP